MSKIKTWVSRHFWLMINTPDDKSQRMLIFIPFPNRKPFWGPKLLCWKYDERPRLEKFLAKFWIWPSY